ncbi:hypothetical protein [Corynebacterium bovis]|uniref:hypothetical protein n=1 Tax=Corynebacterium bovis TaxID=36808 RepID=UPI000F6512EB|nr:hypothetical protein [Corynebacterium bovis]
MSITVDVTVPGRRAVAGVVAVVTAAAAVSSCSSDDAAGGGQVDLTSPPAPVSWSSMSGVKVPGGDQGPRQTSPVRRGYEHSPQGAVLAAVNGQALMSLAPNEDTQEVADFVLAPGPGRDQWVQARALANISGSVDQETAPRFTGFKVADYDDGSAQVIVAAQYRQPETWTGVYPVQLKWINDDWRVVNPTREAGVHVTPVDNTDGFTDLSADNQGHHG